jgi:hypothetical protein
MRIVVREVKCPKCGAEEMHPNKAWVLIRGFKVHHSGKWWSQCLVCAGFYDKELKPVGETQPWDRNLGWFA